MFYFAAVRAQFLRQGHSYLGWVNNAVDSEVTGMVGQLREEPSEKLFPHPWVVSDV